MRAEAYAELGNADQAVDDFQAALESDPTLASARGELCDALLARGRPENRETYFRISACLSNVPGGTAPPKMLTGPLGSPVCCLILLRTSVYRLC
jgi:DNA-binding SARP family transcriptional activator